MKNYKLTISYDGSRYHGWERKKNVDTIQGKIEDVLERLCGAEVKLIGAGRTDAGVHAKAMIANVHMDTESTTDKIKCYLNRYLPDDIAILDVKEVSERFHARYHAIGKTYRYSCYIGDVKPLFRRKYVTNLNSMGGHPETLNIEQMRKAAQHLIGEHDFRSFCGNKKMKKSTIRRIDSIDITREGDYIYMDYHGNGFLQNMVRILSGTLLEVGYGRTSVNQIPAMLEALDRSAAGPMAPSQGLCLMKIDY